MAPRACGQRATVSHAWRHSAAPRGKRGGLGVCRITGAARFWPASPVDAVSLTALPCPPTLLACNCSLGAAHLLGCHLLICSRPSFCLPLQAPRASCASLRAPPTRTSPSASSTRSGELARCGRVVVTLWSCFAATNPHTAGRLPAPTAQRSNHMRGASQQRVACSSCSPLPAILAPFLLPCLPPAGSTTTSGGSSVSTSAASSTSTSTSSASATGAELAQVLALVRWALPADSVSQACLATALPGHCAAVERRRQLRQLAAPARWRRLSPGATSKFGCTTAQQICMDPIGAHASEAPF